MGFPWIVEANFESGAIDTAIFDGSNVDTESKMAVRHYSWMARQGAFREVPYAGAYCLHIDLSLGVADAYLESTAWATALDGTIATRFAFLASGLVMGATDRFGIFALQSAGPVNEGMVEVRMSSGDLQLVTSEAGATPVVACSLLQDQWHIVQLVADIDAGGGNDGSLQLWVDGFRVGTLASLNQAAITLAILGAFGLDAGTTAGHLFFDIVAADTERLPESNRNENPIYLTATGHAVVGRGQLQRRQLLDSGNATARLRLYDTDVGDITAREIIPAGQYNDLWNREESAEGYFERGVYAVFEGTTPQAFLSFQDRCFAPGGVANAAHQRATR